MQNSATVLVGLVLFVAFIAAVAGGLRHRKKGREGGCSSGCDGCPARGSCHRSDGRERDKK